MKQVISALATILLTAAGALAQSTLTEVFDPNFKSLQLFGENNRQLPPIIRLGVENSFVTLTFDELGEAERPLRARLVHCNRQWQRSSIPDTDYVEGFNYADITDYALSRSTLVHYVNYQLTIPNPDLTPLLSGNYLVEVYDPDEPNEVLLQGRFMVSEDVATIHAKVTTATDVDYNSRHQQLEVDVDLRHIPVDDCINSLQLVIVQNGRICHTLDHPQRITPQGVIYAHQPQLIFPAGNEFRRFEITNVKYPGMGVARYDYISPYYHVELLPDKPRADQGYLYENDQNGRYFPNVTFSEEPAIESDYLLVHFTLASPRMSGKNVYLEGDLTLNKLDEDSEMIYDTSLEAYTKTLMLKQGLYNYRYTTGDDSDNNPLEGNHHETNNEYELLLYYSPPMARYDRLIGSLLIQ